MRWPGRRAGCCWWLAASLAVAAARAASLSVGDCAPPLHVGEWIRGPAVDSFEPGKVYVVEFWATWCFPCRAAIPHLNTLQSQFRNKGVIIIGQSVRERNGPADVPVVRKIAEQMTYPVAIDSPEGRTEETWLTAAGIDGIPTAFVIDREGVIAWIGDGAHLEASLLEDVLLGRLDLGRATAGYEASLQVEQQIGALTTEFRHYRSSKQWGCAESTLDQIEELIPKEERDGVGLTRVRLFFSRDDDKGACGLAAHLVEVFPTNVALLEGLASEIAARPNPQPSHLALASHLATEANALTGARDGAILHTLARILALQGNMPAAIDLEQEAATFAAGRNKRQCKLTLANYRRDRIPDVARIELLREEFGRILESKDWIRAQGILSELETLLLPEDYAWLGNALAWDIAIATPVQPKDLALAEEVAVAANRAAAGQNEEVLDTLARVRFQRGQRQQAISLQEQAVARAEKQRKVQFQETLDSYKSDRLPKSY